MERALRDLARNMGEPRGTTLRVGFLEHATYPDGTSVPTVAFWNEFGTKTAPPRPFFRNMVKAHKGEWGDNAAALFKYHKGDVQRVADLMGLRLKDQLQTSIYSNTPPPNAPATIARKGHGQTLIDTGFMASRVAWEVKEGLPTVSQVITPASSGAGNAARARAAKDTTFSRLAKELRTYSRVRKRQEQAGLRNLNKLGKGK